jgi:hypothetical protein
MGHRQTIAAQQECCKDSNNVCSKVRFPMNETEVIIEVGAELVSIGLYGIRTEQGWFFTREVMDQTPDLMDQEWIQHKSAVVNTWEAALILLDKYHWFKLYPIQIHPEFREQNWLAVRERVAKTDISEFALKRWRNICSAR